MSDVPPPIPPQPYRHPQGGPYGPNTSYVPPVAASGTNTLAIIALVLGFLVPIGGIIAGAVALGQIKRTGEKGRGLALGGIFVGIGVIVIFVLAVLALVIAAITAGIAIANERSSGFSSGGADDATSTSLFVGDCVDEDSAQLVDCQVAHDDEVYATSTVTGRDYSEQAVTAKAEDYCFSEFEGFIGLSADESELDYGYYTPDEDTWADGDRQIACVVYDASGQTTGTLRGAER